MSVLLITGTSTDVGKTVVTAALAATMRAAGRRVAVCKPAQTGISSGEAGDLADVTRLSGITDVVELARYPDPLAPQAAAREAGLPELSRRATVDAVNALRVDHDLVLVEGAGGLLVRLGEDGFTIADVARDLGAPVVVVTSADLGTLNHSELTVRALSAEGVTCAGLVIGSWPENPDLAQRCNLDDLPVVTGIAVIGRVPAGSGRLERDRFTSHAASWFDRELLEKSTGGEQVSRSR